MRAISSLFAFVSLFCCAGAAAQQGVSGNGAGQTDLIDLVRNAVKKTKGNRTVEDTAKATSSRLVVSAVPAAGYTLQTGFAGLINANGAFRTNAEANTSTINASFTYTVRNQIIAPLLTNIWTKDNRYNIVGNWRYLKYPSFTYGIGGYSKIDDGYLIDFNAIRLSQAVLRKCGNNFYAGIGYNFDYFWNVTELNPPSGKITDFQKYGLNPTETASGITFNFLYDSRKNSINPEGGDFANVIYRTNLAVLGNISTWRSLVFDLRKYIKWPKYSDNIIALWSYEWFTVTGKPPYLMMPNTGNDPYSNTGRGYIQGRFRGANMAYVEGEYRFSVSRNGLFGGVIFANAESFTELSSNRFETIAPGWGAGIRVKLNKFSRTNIAVDYGFGLGGSQGLFVNLGEVF